MATVQGSPRVVQQRSSREESNHSIAAHSLVNGERQRESPRESSSVSSSPSPNSRKRLHPTSLNIDDGAPPNKRLHTPTKEEKESIMREKAILYRRLAEAEKNPFLQTIFPFLPFNATGKFSPVPPLYTLLQQQSPPRPPSSVPSPYNLSGGIAAAVNITPVAGQPGSVVNSSLGITGLPTPGGSSVGSVSTPPRPSYPSQFYPASLMKYPFSPPTPSSLSGFSLLSPFNASSVNNSEAQASTSRAHAASGDTSSAKALASSTPKDMAGRDKGGSDAKDPKSKAHKNTNIPSAAHMVTATWQPTNALSGSVQSPLNYFHPSPLSPMMFISSPYPNSVSSCISVSSSSGCSSSSETMASAATDSGDNAPESSDSNRLSAINARKYAPSEYHVGPHRPWSEKVVDEIDEGADNSGRNTPIDMESISDNAVNPGDLSRVSHNLMLSTSATSQFNGSAALTPGSGAAQPTAADARYVQPGQTSSQGHSQTLYPLSVESLRSSSITHPGYLSNCHSSTSVERPSSGVSSMSSSVSSRGSTPEPDDMKPDPSRTPQGADTFCLVPGRLSLLSSTQKYKVTVDEVRRRLSHPECLNASVLGGILRRAKSKNGGHVLRQRLESIGVSLPPGRRKATELSLLTSLVEGESLHLASDFRRLCNNFFPQSELAQIIARQHAGTPEAQHRISMVKATHLIVSELQAMLNAVGGPSNIRPNDPNNPYPGLTNFGLVTHGFGNPAINTSLNVLQTYLQELLAYYEGRKPIPPPDSSRYGFSTSSVAPPSASGGDLHHQNLHSNSYSTGQTESASSGRQTQLPNSEIAITGETRSRELVNMGMVLKQEPSDPTS